MTLITPPITTLPWPPIMQPVPPLPPNGDNGIPGGIVPPWLEDGEL